MTPEPAHSHDKVMDACSMDILLATSNPGKVREIAALLPDGFRVHSLSEFPAVPEPEEPYDTFAENAIVKVKYYADKLAYPVVLADDSGLCVWPLGGAPGVHSARYCGLPGGRDIVDPANNRLLLQNMEGIQDRSASFVCVLALYDHGTIGTYEGRVDGRILDHESGIGGFGYDPLFVPVGEKQSFGQMNQEQKARHSHRANAVRSMIAARGWLR